MNNRIVNVSYHLGVGCVVAILVGGLIGLSIVEFASSDFFHSPIYTIAEDVLGILVLVFFGCAAVTWSYAYRLTKSQWSSLNTEQRMTRTFLLVFAFYLVGFYFFRRDRDQNGEIVN